MPSTSEIGHSKNVANFHDLIAYCIGYAGNYSPTRTDLTIPNLLVQETDSKAAIDDVLIKKTAYNSTVNARMIAFKDIRTLATRLISALQATSASTELINDAKSYNKKIQGIRAGKIVTPVDPNAPVPVTISTSQLSYDQIVRHFAGIIEVIQSEPSYSPNEAALQVPNLIIQKNDLIAKNEAISTAHTDWSNAIITRDRLLYLVPTGLVPIAADVKLYVKSVFGASSDQYRQVRSVPFRTLKK